MRFVERWNSKKKISDERVVYDVERSTNSGNRPTFPRSPTEVPLRYQDLYLPSTFSLYWY